MGSLKSYVWTTSTTRWKSLLRTPRLWAPFRGSNHQSSCSQWEKWMIWPICWVVSLWWKPALFWSTFGNTIGKYFQCISFSGTLMLTRNDLGNVFQYSCMETREFITKKMEYWSWVFKGLLGLDPPNAQLNLVKILERLAKEYHWIFCAQGSKPASW